MKATPDTHALVYNDKASALAIRNLRHKDRVVARIGKKFAIVEKAFADRMKLTVV